MRLGKSVLKIVSQAADTNTGRADQTMKLLSYLRSSNNPVAPLPDDAPLIVRVDAAHRHKLAAHLLRLGADDRYLRFGFHASDTVIADYVAQIDLDFDDVFAVLGRDLQIKATAHVAYNKAPNINHAEFGVSVDAEARGQGLGYALMQRAIMHARTREVERFFIQALGENQTMLNLARKGGMTLASEGGEVSGFLRLPPSDESSQRADRDAEQQAAAELARRKRSLFQERLRHWWVSKRAVAFGH
jgi:GNAT superfamily N-acetyltransferase